MSRIGCKDSKPRKKRTGPGPNTGKKASAESLVKARAGKLRAGNRKCTRCKVVFYKERGVLKGLCLRCREHCSRCDVLLTEENRWTPSKGSKAYQCKPCFKRRYVIKGVKGLSERDFRLNKAFGITVDEYEEILKRQNGTCWICEKPPKEGGNRLAVDHLHSKGEKKRNPREKRGRVRGLLCWGCNAAIGKFKDDITKLRRAAEYLEVWPAQQVLNKEK